MDISQIKALTPEQEKIKFLSWLQEYIGSEQQEFENERDADYLANKQTLRWQRLLQILNSNQPRIQDIGYVFQAFNNLISKIDASIIKSSKSFIVRSNLPLLFDDLDQVHEEQLSRFSIIGMLFLLTKIKVQRSAPADAKIIPAIFSSSAFEISSLLAKGYVQSELAENQKDIEKLESEYTQIHNSAVEKLNSYEDAFSILYEQQENNISTYQSQIDKITYDLEAKYEKELLAFKTEIKTYAKIKDALNLWEDKAAAHTTAYQLLGYCFLLILIATITYFLSVDASRFLSHFKNLPVGQTYLPLAFILIPTIGIGWLLRYLAKFSIHNFNLAEDAKQRHVQTETYLRLLGDPNQPISERERILALAALFRPLPGQGSDDVSPPSAADLLFAVKDKFVK
ncbi:MAG: DUF6161 domain-containing protein [Pseudomonadota bacterium]